MAGVDLAEVSIPLIHREGIKCLDEPYHVSTKSTSKILNIIVPAFTSPPKKNNQILTIEKQKSGFDPYGYKTSFSPTRPWLFQDFDLLTFHAVSEAELTTSIALFHAGKYEFSWTPAEFDMAAHNDLLTSTAAEVAAIRAEQRRVQEEMIRAEKSSLAKWREEKGKRAQADEGQVESLLRDPGVKLIEAPVDANVWKVEVKEGDVMRRNSVVVILEAMKLEINVCVPDDGDGGGEVVVEKVLVEPGETIRAGGRIALVRMK